MISLLLYADLASMLLVVVLTRVQNLIYIVQLGPLNVWKSLCRARLLVSFPFPNRDVMLCIICVSGHAIRRLHFNRAGRGSDEKNPRPLIIIILDKLFQIFLKIVIFRIDDSIRNFEIMKLDNYKNSVQNHVGVILIKCTRKFVFN